MANVQHASLPDAQLHEPKGVASASSGEVYVADGSGSGNWAKASTTFNIERILDGLATDAIQAPSAVDTPLQINFGPAVNTGADPVSLTAAGAVNINQTGLYRVKLRIQFGRAGGAGTAVLFFRALVNGVQAGQSIAVKLDNVGQQYTLADEAWLYLPAGTVITYELMRDSAGTNSGGLFETGPTTLAWNNSPSAAIRVERWT